MYPIVPQFVFDGSNGLYCAKLSESEKSLRKNQFEIENILKFSSNGKLEKGVFLLENIVKNTTTQSFSFNDLSLDLNFPNKFSVKLSENDKRLTPVDGVLSNKFWIRNIRIASDIPATNAVLELREDKIEVVVIKNLTANDELLLWFSEELVSLLNIPFLTPANIQGQKCYICHHCYRIFENPNPLKIHLATNCDRFDENLLWQKIQTELLSRHQRKMLSDNNVIRNYEVLNQSPTSSQSAPSPVSLRRFSAFQPVNSFKNGSMNVCHPITPSPPPLIQSISPASTSSMNESSALAAAAHLETIVSNMGTSKQGHLCIYCGKLYSRKYGLKIHIRTHTGFKPLKCKYCFRPFGDPSNLNKHVRLHKNTQNNSMYKCTICNKMLIRRRDLQRHLQIKHGNDLHVLEKHQQQNSENDMSSTPVLMSPIFKTSSSENEEAD